MVHRSLSYSLLVLLLAAPACDEPTGRTDGQATLNHSNNAQADRTYAYVVLG